MVLHPHTLRGPRFSICLATSISLLLFSSLVSAQEPQPIDVISLRTDLVAAPFTREAEAAHAAFSVQINLSALGDRTAIFDAGVVAIQAYASRGENSPERRIAILISDGLDTASRANAQTVIAAANRTDVSFY